MNGSARALGVLIILAVSSALMVAGVTVAFGSPDASGGTLAGATLVLAGGALLARLWQVQRRIILR